MALYSLVSVSRLRNNTLVQFGSKEASIWVDRLRRKISDTRVTIKHKTQTQNRIRRRSRTHNETETRIRHQRQTQTHNRNRSQTHNGTETQTHNRNQSQTHNETETQTQNRNRSQTHYQTKTQTNNRNRSQTHNETKTQTHNRNRSQIHNETETKTHNRNRRQTHNGTETQTHNRNRSQTHYQTETQTHDRNRSQTHNETETQTHNRNRSQTHYQTKTQTHNRNRSQTHNETKTQTHNRNRSQTHNETETQTHNRNRSQTHNETETQTHNRNRSQTHNETKTQTHNRNRSQIHNETKTQTHNRNRSQTHNETEIQTHNRNRSQTHNETETQTHNQNRRSDGADAMNRWPAQVNPKTGTATPSACEKNGQRWWSYQIRALSRCFVTQSGATVFERSLTPDGQSGGTLSTTSRRDIPRRTGAPAISRSRPADTTTDDSIPEIQSNVQTTHLKNPGTPRRDNFVPKTETMVADFTNLESDTDKSASATWRVQAVYLGLLGQECHLSSEDKQILMTLTDLLAVQTIRPTYSRAPFKRITTHIQKLSNRRKIAFNKGNSDCFIMQQRLHNTSQRDTTKAILHKQQLKRLRGFPKRAEVSSRRVSLKALRRRLRAGVTGSDSIWPEWGMPASGAPLPFSRRPPVSEEAGLNDGAARVWGIFPTNWGNMCGIIWPRSNPNLVL
ncbi:unnamed protein product [Nesidiocoris tenuis]|uniref:Uncharacterized protein n=1 Tax=Nesidiocoris tenuis TaxID=355587 RepID=A0A6H5GN83_9HEMI|nr:unnamed protein product [Nesidiocoris tenuis]